MSPGNSLHGQQPTTTRKPPDIENDETGQYDGVFLNKVLSAS
ncbi:MAG: hypothetical protein ACLR30_03695 [[Clostridium] leptum]